MSVFYCPAARRTFGRNVAEGVCVVCPEPPTCVGAEEDRRSGNTDDSEIAARVVAALRRELPLCCQQLRPLVRQGRVTLEGSVEWIHERAEAESIVRGVPGVVAVVNSIVFCGHL